jgi:hypothetical protein
MKFAVEPAPFLKLVQMVGDRKAGSRRRDFVLRLVACGGRVCVERGKTVAEIDAAVWEEGQCELSRSRLTGALAHYLGQSELTLETEKLGLRVGELVVPIIHYSPQTAVPTTFQIFLASDSEFITSIPFLPAEPAAAL